MKTASTTAVITVLLASVVGCRHNTNVAPPPQAQAPVGPPSGMTHTPSMPPLPPPTPWDVAFSSPKEENPAPATPPRRTPRHKPAPAKPAAADPATQTAEKSGTAAQPPQTANNGAASTEVSPIGQLSSTGEGTTSQGRHDIEQLIASIESGLNNIKRPLSTEEQATSTQIKTFLTKAKQELIDNDLDGAQTLATKAKVLLEELTKK